MSRVLGLTRGTIWPLPRPHAPEHDCFACAEIRVERGRPPLVPLLARRRSRTNAKITWVWHRQARRRGTKNEVKTPAKLVAKPLDIDSRERL